MESFKDEITPHHLSEFLKTHRSHGTRILESLGKDSPIVLALKTEVGRVILGKLVGDLDRTLSEMLVCINNSKNTETRKEKDLILRVKYLTLYKILYDWSEIVLRHEKNTKKVITNTLK